MPLALVYVAHWEPLLGSILLNKYELEMKGCLQVTYLREYVLVYAGVIFKIYHKDVLDHCISIIFNSNFTWHQNTQSHHH